MQGISPTLQACFQFEKSELWILAWGERLGQEVAKTNSSCCLLWIIRDEHFACKRADFIHNSLKSFHNFIRKELFATFRTFSVSFLQKKQVFIFSSLQTIQNIQPWNLALHHHLSGMHRPSNFSFAATCLYLFYRHWIIIA